ncbi:MAG: preprotein translocase subunit SecY [Elusimicrobia bacterium]|nr:preprotein translocase subunit SecY [Elusimicrobiota bacterium]
MQSFADIFKIPELRKRVFFTLGILVVYRVGVAIPIPGIDSTAIQQLFKSQANNFLGFLDMFSGGAMSRMSIFAMGVMPYINSSIIMSLLQGAHVIPYLDRLAKEGESGRRQLNKITRYFTLLLAVIQSFGLTTLITKIRLGNEIAVVREPGALFIFTTVLTLTAGTIFIMWLGEQITEWGVGNGISLMIFTGIVDRLPSSLNQMRKMVFDLQEMSLLTALSLGALVVIVVGLVVWVETAQRKIPVQYARRMVGRKMYGGASTFLPLKVNQSGVIAVIFAVSLLSVPVTFASFNPDGEWSKRILGLWNQRALWYEATYAGLIIFFCYFYNSVSFNPVDLADNLKKWGGFIPGIRPGEPTAEYINAVSMRITLGGALFVAALAIMPDILHRVMNTPFYFGGTSILIVVGVALDTVGQLESHLIMRHYEGFSKTGRVKGRWFNVGAGSQS